MVQRALNLVDPRLVDHGLRVAASVDAMLEHGNTLGSEDRRDAYLLALFHDIGAYRTEEIDRMIDFESETVWEHSVYGYLFLRELSPLSRLSEVVLYHHAPSDRLADVDPKIAHVSRVFHVADRADVFKLANPGAAREDLYAWLRSMRGDLDPDAVELFIAVDKPAAVEQRLPEKLGADRVLSAYPLSDADAAGFLNMLVHVIDFRSFHTVAHTVTTAQIAVSLAKLLGCTDDDIAAVYDGALVHDLGKIGIPLQILEKPGALTPSERSIMQSHVELTEHIIEGYVDPLRARIALRHHEKLDGSGYPLGLCGADLTELERIVAVADIVSALAGTRSYKEAYGRERVVAIIAEMAGEGRVDSRISEAAISHYDAIMEEVRLVSAPVVSAYERIQAEYGTLIATLA